VHSGVVPAALAHPTDQDGIGGWTLAAGIYLLTLYIAYLTGFFPMLLTMMFPFVGQVYWIFAIWSATGIFFNALTQLCLLWILVMLAAFGASALSEK
jgi:hypothetical protein